MRQLQDVRRTPENEAPARGQLDPRDQPARRTAPVRPLTPDLAAFELLGTAGPGDTLAAPSSVRIRRAASSGGPFAAPAAHSRIRRAVDKPVIRRLLDTAYEDDVFDIAQGKRETELSNLRFQSPGLGAADPRRQSLEAFFADPSHQKGSRSRPAKLTGAAAPHRAGRGQSPAAPLPDVLVVGPDAATAPRLPEQAEAEHRINDIADAAVAKAPSASAFVTGLKAKALAELAGVARSKLAETNRSLGTGDDTASLARRADAIVTQFRTDVSSKASTEQWNASVQERQAFVASKPNADMATQALQHANDSVALAGQIYDLLYAPLAFADASIARVTALGAERRLVELHATFPAAAWPSFLEAATGLDGRLAFALDKGAELAGAVAPGPALRVWFANPAKVTSAADAQAILGLNLVANDPKIGAPAARLLGKSMIPNLAALIAIDASGTFASIAEITGLAGLGGDLVSSRQMRALPGPPRDDHLTAFNQRAGTTAAEVAAEWAHLSATIATTDEQAMIIRAFALAPDAGRTDLRRMVDNWVAMSDRATVEGNVVAALVAKGMLVAKGKLYNSGTWGHGGVYRFELAGGGRIEAEWHIHYQSGGGNREASIAGAGWKNKAQKYGSGQKSFDGNEPKLVDAMRAKGAWLKKVF